MPTIYRALSAQQDLCKIPYIHDLLPIPQQSCKVSSIVYNPHFAEEEI